MSRVSRLVFRPGTSLTLLSSATLAVMLVSTSCAHIQTSTSAGVDRRLASTTEWPAICAILCQERESQKVYPILVSGNSMESVIRRFKSKCQSPVTLSYGGPSQLDLGKPEPLISCTSVFMIDADGPVASH